MIDGSGGAPGVSDAHLVLSTGFMGVTGGIGQVLSGGGGRGSV